MADNKKEKKEAEHKSSDNRYKYQDWITKDAVIILQGWARDGLTMEQIAHNMGINPSTLKTWRDKYDVINNALKKGKEVIDYEVENALLRSALGFVYETEILDKNNRVVKVKQYALPNITAQIFWLKNRKPKEWREKIDAIIDKVNDANRVKIVNDLDKGDLTNGANSKTE